MNWSLFLLRNISKEKIYWEGSASIFNFKFVPHTIIHSLLKFYCTHVNVILLLARIKTITL